MSAPWPSFGGFLFKRDETPLFGTDVGWTYSPGISRNRIHGSNIDSVTVLNIGSAERSFEIYLTNTRLNSLLMFLGTKASFTDWERPIPETRNAVLVTVEPLETAFSYIPGGKFLKKHRTRIVLVST